MFSVYLLGTAGSGKSSLTSSFSEWLRGKNLNLITVNLDPSVIQLPYSPDVDVRDFIDIEEIMREYGLGPNGALIFSADMIAEKVEEIKDEIEELRPELILVDTPGQMELFTYRSSGPFIVTMLGGSQGILLFLVDPVLAKRPSDFVSLLLLGASTQYRFSIPQLNLLSKSDLLSDAEIERLLNWSEDPYELLEAVREETGGLRKEVSIEICRALGQLEVFSILLPVSASRNTGLENLYAELSRIFWGGEDIGV